MGQPHSITLRDRRLVKFALLGIFCLLSLVAFYSRSRLEWATWPSGTQHLSHASERPFSPLDYLKGPPMLTFRDNLREEHHYVTASPYAGITNTFISYCNLIYIGLLSSRIPVLPPFHAVHHFSVDVQPLIFGDIFDIPYLVSQIHSPVLQWSDIKIADYFGTNYTTEQLQSGDEEKLSCWTMYEGYDSDYGDVFLGLNIDYTPVPDKVQLESEPEGDHRSLFELGSLIDPEQRAQALQYAASAVSPDDSPIPPDDHLACFDILYYTAAHKSFEFQETYSPVWRFVGRHMKFTQKIEDLARLEVRKAFGLLAHEVDVPYIAVHARRGDFKHNCSKGGSRDNCLPSLTAYHQHVRQIQEMISKRSKEGDVGHVLMTSDEMDPAWWAEVKRLGWSYIDYSDGRVMEEHGPWYPSFIDISAQAGAVGFVGTERSTLSLVSARRVKDWHQGPSIMAKWESG